ncbi:hypothetical protein CPB84DRAFT_278414 [Gymnopilus junonius]|uniref:Uncharacterized protein n=1 Tax=Gymnopilus junonius TaxID=109634 RepID=A0A9P5NFG0_GYMJU|nr:hypothetical protein CPB84DRAFT_278414 [Gymnopilus junonius]
MNSAFLIMCIGDGHESESLSVPCCMLLVACRLFLHLCLPASNPNVTLPHRYLYLLILASQVPLSSVVLVFRVFGQQAASTPFLSFPFRLFCLNSNPYRLLSTSSAQCAMLDICSRLSLDYDTTITHVDSCVLHGTRMSLFITTCELIPFLLQPRPIATMYIFPVQISISKSPTLSVTILNSILHP